MHPEPPASLHVEPKSSSKGCWIAGCGGCLGIVILCAVASWTLYQSIQKDLAVEPFAPVVVSAPERQVMENKVRVLKLAGEGKAPAAAFTGIRITEQEVNAWISSQGGDLADQLRVDFEKDSLTVELRVGDDPKKRMRLTATLLIRQKAGGLEVELARIRLGGFPVPTILAEAATGGDLMRKLVQDKALLQLLEERVEKIELEKDAFLFVPKLPLEVEAR